MFAAEDGQALFDAKGAMCHGKDGVAKPMAKGSKNFNDAAWQKTATADGIAKIVTDGKGTMKGFAGKLTPDQVTAISAYGKTSGAPAK